MRRLDLYCSVDAFWQQFEPLWEHQHVANGRRRRRATHHGRKKPTSASAEPQPSKRTPCANDVNCAAGIVFSLLTFASRFRCVCAERGWNASKPRDP